VIIVLSNYVQEKRIETFEKTQPDGETKQVFFFDPDGESFWTCFPIASMADTITYELCHRMSFYASVVAKAISAPSLLWWNSHDSQVMA